MEYRIWNKTLNQWAKKNGHDVAADDAEIFKTRTKQDAITILDTVKMISSCHAIPKYRNNEFEIKEISED